jgi:hypothetical protein
MTQEFPRAIIKSHDALIGAAASARAWVLKVADRSRRSPAAGIRR